MNDWVTLPSTSNKLNQTYFQNFIDVSGVMSVRNSNNINLYTSGSIPDFSINSHQIRVKENETYYDISNSKLRFIQNLYENVQDKLEDLTSRTQYLTTSSNDGKAIFGSSIEISNNLICFSDLSLSGNLFIDNYSTFNGQVDICGNLYANYPNNSIPISAITNLEYNLNTKSNLISPDFTGIPTAPTADSGTNTNQIATTAFVAYAISGLSNQSTLDASLNLKADLASPTFTGTVSGITKSMVGLGNVDNTSDASKPVSTAQQTALDLKANLASPTFTGTVSGITKSMVGLGSVDNTSDTSKPVSTAQQTALDLKANITYVDASLNLKADLASPTFTGTVSGITKSMVGLSNVDNTSDASKPVSTAQQTALDLKANITYMDASLNLKADLASPTFTGTVSGITKSMVGLGNVDNTSDASKPVSTAQQTALDLKANITYVDASLNLKADVTYVDTSVSNLVNSAPETLNTLNELAAALGDDANFSTTITNSIATKAPINNPTFTGTVGGITKSMVGLGNVDNTSDASKPVSTAQQTALDLKANLASPTFTGTVSGITKFMVDLGNVDNTSDTSKPVSTAQQTALDLKADLASPTFTGTPTVPTATAGTNTTQIATTAFVTDAVSDVAIDLTQDINVNSLTVGKGGGNVGTNTVFGSGALSSNTTGYENVAIGNGVLNANTNGYRNLAIGVSSLFTNTSGYQNMSFGRWNLFKNTTGSENCSVGFQSLYWNTTGSNNSVIGNKAGHNNTTASNNTFIGSNTNISPTNATWSNSTALGYGALITASNQIVLGRSSETVVVPGAMTISGIPTAPTATSGTNTTQIATTAFVSEAISVKADLASPTFTGTVSGITNSMVGLGNVDNTSDANKPVSTAQQTALDLKANLASPTFTGTVSGITNSMVGLGNVDNTSDASKPVSTAQQTALDLKANITYVDASLNLKADLASPTFTGTVSGITNSMVGLGNVDNTSDANKPVSAAQQTALDLKANLASPTFTGTVSGITNSMVGLGNVDNTSDANKPVSTAQQTALDLKADLASPTFTGTPNAPTATSGTNTTQIATTAFVTDAVSDVAIDLTQDISINSITVGRGSGNQTTNTVFGNDALSANTSYVYNTAFGYRTLKNTINNSNSAFGTDALLSNTNGAENSAFGALALYTNLTSYGNSAFGALALRNSTSAGNSAFGNYALKNTTTGSLNTGFGKNAGYNNTTAANNTFIGASTNISPTTATWTNSTALGYGALITASNQVVLGRASETVVVPGQMTVSGVATAPTAASGTNTTQIATTAFVTDAVSDVAIDLTQDISINSITVGRGSGNKTTNTVFGNDALSANTNYSFNTAFGYRTLKNTINNHNSAFGTNALLSNTNGAENSAFGAEALYTNLTSYGNSAFGSAALRYSTSAGNSAFGNYALYNTTTGNGNTGFGKNSGFNNTTAANNTFIGASTNISPTTATWTQSTALGYGALITASNQIVLGNSSISSLNCQVQTITSLSDARDKKNIQPLTNGITFVEKLTPVKFDWNMRDGGKVDIPEMGFIAQDLQQVQQETGIIIPGLVSDSNPDRLEASYGTLVPILVKATQDLSKQVNELKTINATLQSQLNSIMTILTNNNLS